MIIRRLPEPRERRQCDLPKEQLDPGTVGFKGYREQRVKLNGFNPDRCMRVASWQVNDKMLCTQHAGICVLEHYEEKDEPNSSKE